METEYVYKATRDSITTLQILGKTNESRKDVFDPNFAKFRCSKALVIDIEDFWTKEKKNLTRSIHKNNFIYEIGKEVVPDMYYEHLNVVCASGIHYFKTKEAAEAYFLEYSNRIQDGLQRRYYNSGRLLKEFTMKGQYLDGLFRVWYENGVPKEEYTYIDCIKNGLYRKWHENGQLKEEYTFKNDKIEGLYSEWYENGQLRKEYTIINHIKNGLYRKWHENGQLKEEYTFKNDKIE